MLSQHARHIKILLKLQLPRAFLPEPSLCLRENNIHSHFISKKCFLNRLSNGMQYTFCVKALQDFVITLR